MCETERQDRKRDLTTIILQLLEPVFNPQVSVKVKVLLEKPPIRNQWLNKTHKYRALKWFGDGQEKLHLVLYSSLTEVLFSFRNAAFAHKPFMSTCKSIDIYVYNIINITFLSRHVFPSLWSFRDKFYGLSLIGSEVVTNVQQFWNIHRFTMRSWF